MLTDEYFSSILYNINKQVFTLFFERNRGNQNDYEEF